MPRKEYDLGKYRVFGMIDLVEVKAELLDDSLKAGMRTNLIISVTNLSPSTTGGTPVPLPGLAVNLVIDATSSDPPAVFASPCTIAMLSAAETETCTFVLEAPDPLPVSADVAHYTFRVFLTPLIVPATWNSANGDAP